MLQACSICGIGGDIESESDRLLEDGTVAVLQFPAAKPGVGTDEGGFDQVTSPMDISDDWATVAY